MSVEYQLGTLFGGFAYVLSPKSIPPIYIYTMSYLVR